jgi:hypothetical protein
MDKIFSGIAFIIAIPFITALSWLVGTIFRSMVLKNDINNGNKYLQFVITVLIGIFIIIILGTIMDEMGCSSDDEFLYRR